MAAAIPAAVGLGTSLVGGISGKGARKKQEKLAEQQRKELAPFISAQLGASKDALSQAKTLFGQASPYIQGAGSALQDLQSFWRPAMMGDQSAISRFFAPEFGQINQGYRSASENIARFAPRGGGRVGNLARADIQRQMQMNDVRARGRLQAAEQQRGIAGDLGQLGLGTGGLGTSLFGQGLQGGNTAAGLLSGQQNRAYDAQFNQGGKSPFEAAGGFLVDLFKGLPSFGGGKKSSGSTGQKY